jgi:2-hydroxy-6-oxo-6-(2'-aminophenyl)hexa-2,4-dienoate hydrolase
MNKKGEKMTKISEKIIQTGDVKTFYLDAGEGQPLILLHGGGAGADAKGNWSSVIEHYVKQSFRVIAFDAVGFGKSDKPNPNTFVYDQQSRVNQLIDLIDALELENPIVVGNSMGGLTTLHAAYQHPDKIDKIILMGTGKPKTNSEGMNSLVNYSIDEQAMYNIVRNLTNPDYEASKEMVDYRLALTKQPGIMESYAATMKGIVELQIDDSMLEAIQHKALLVHGTLDRMVPLERSLHLLDKLPNAWAYIMPHCGHWAMMEYPEEFARVTVDFITNH